MLTKPAALWPVHVRTACLCALLSMGTLPSLADPIPPPPDGWKKVFSQFEVYVHVGSVTRAEANNGSTMLSVWSFHNLQGEPVKVGTVIAKSVRTLHTIDCKWRSESHEYRVFANWNGAGAQLEEIAATHMKRIEPESFEDVLAHKYCSALTFWR